MKYKTVIISGFPGIGKSYLSEKSNLKISDSDSSIFPKDNFPTNYINHIKELMGGRHIILVSSHKGVREALVAEGINFKLAYPSKDQKADYAHRYVARGSSMQFIELLIDNFELWIEELENQEGCDHIVLKKGQYLTDALIENWVTHSWGTKS